MPVQWTRKPRRRLLMTVNANATVRSACGWVLPIYACYVRKNAPEKP